MPSLADGAGEKEREMFETLVEVNSSSILCFQHVPRPNAVMFLCGRLCVRLTRALSGDDLKIFMGLLSDLFPNVEVGHGLRKSERTEKTRANCTMLKFEHI